MRASRLASLSATAAFAALLLGSNGPRALAADVSDADKAFVTAAASGGMAEVKLGQYAADNASEKKVKGFGKHMVKDHTKANKELQEIAAKESVDFPPTETKEDSDKGAPLMKLTGTEFDKAYVAAMVEDHQKTIELFQNEANSGTDPALKKFAADTLPTLKKHLEMAQKLQDTVNGSK